MALSTTKEKPVEGTALDLSHSGVQHGEVGASPMTRQWFYRAASLGLFGLALTGCRQDMQNQPKMLPLRATTQMPDGRSALTQVAETIARSQGRTDDYLQTGLTQGVEGKGMPFGLNMDVLQRGQERYNIFCSPCHSRVGNGLGMVVRRGYHRAGDFHTERLREAPLGHFFAVITHGYGAMPNYAAEVAVHDRWAIAAYIRALQLSQNARPEDLAGGTPPARLQDIAARSGVAMSFDGPWDPPPIQPRATSEPRTQQTAPGGSTQNGAWSMQDAAKHSQTPALPSAEPVHTAKAPSEQAAPSGDAASGRSIYAQQCQLCHQKTREGLPPMIPSLLGIAAKVGDARLHSVIVNGIPTGKPPMPPNPTLTEQDIDDLIAYLHSEIDLKK
jgi:mono/diheme cytochrome c family protein